MGGASFGSQTKYYSSIRPYYVAVGDSNNDTRPNTIVTNYDFHPYSVVVGDFNNDTILDIVVANYGSNNIGVFLGDNNGTFDNIIPFSIGYGTRPFSVVVGDFNNDRKLDSVVANHDTDSLHILLQTC
jgi:hypothetical protein